MSQNQNNQFLPGDKLVQPSRLGTIAWCVAVGGFIVAALKMGGEALGTQTWKDHK